MAGSIAIHGTIHNSEESFRLVRKSIRERDPDVVAVELPPEHFEDRPSWSVTSTVDPTANVSVPGLVLQRVAIEGDIWQVDEMPFAARVAVDNDARVALIDQPFADSMDAIARGILTDLSSNLKLLRSEVETHRELAINSDWMQLLQRDLWKAGVAVSPLVHYVRALRRHGVTDITDAKQREEAMAEFDPEEAATFLDVVRTVAPNWVQANVDDRDARMAGHLRYLYDEGYDVLAFVGSGHVSEIRNCLEQGSNLNGNLIRAPEFADPADVPQKDALQPKSD